MIGRDELYARRCVRDLVFVIEQIPLRAAVRSPLALDHVSIHWVALWTLLRWERNFLLRGLERRGVDLWKLGCELDDLIGLKREEDASLHGHEVPTGPWSTVPDVQVDHLLYPLLDQAAFHDRRVLAARPDRRLDCVGALLRGFLDPPGGRRRLRGRLPHGRCLLPAGASCPATARGPTGRGRVGDRRSGGRT